jgi:molybdenum cofactor biosynthesis protein B
MMRVNPSFSVLGGFCKDSASVVCYSLESVRDREIGGIVGHQEHERRARAEAPASIRCGIITISDTRTPETDTSGAAIRAGLENQGHTVVRYAVARDEPAEIVALVRELIGVGCQVILTNGGTGISRRDSTFEAIDGLLQKRLPGFGELFRMLSYADIGPAAMLSRATAGTLGDALIFCLPGSSGAVRLALEKLILPELPHLVWEILRQKG